MKPSEPAPAKTARNATDLVSRDLADQQDAVRARIARAAAQKPVEHPTVEQRQKKGRIARAQTPREDLSSWIPVTDGRDATGLLVGQESSRVVELVPLRHARMAASAFAFYRGGALVMATDLATTPRSGLDVQLCGDAHLSNFGLFGAPDRSVVFDVNDFDETNPGPFEWDVKRLATSFVLAARDNGLSDGVGSSAARTAAAAYQSSMADFAQRKEIDIWYDRVDLSSLSADFRASTAQQSRRVKKVSDKDAKKAEVALGKSVAKARSRDAWSAIKKITEVVDGKRQFRNQPPLLARLELSPDLKALINAIFREYRATLQEDRQELLKRYEIVDMGHKVVGVGSVGLLAFVLLMQGRDKDDLMVLQVKQAQESVLEPFTRASGYTKHGHRVVAGQRLMQAASDSFLGWIDGPGGRSFYVRQLRDMKWSPDPSTLDAQGLERFAMLCGHTLARAHARSGDAVALAAYMGSGKAFPKAMAAFASAYADQVEIDYADFIQAIEDGRIQSHDAESDPAGYMEAALAASGR